MSVMRAKLKITTIQQFEGGESLSMVGVPKTKYEDNGLDEDNSYAKFSPQADFKITIMNPDLLGKFKPGQKLYVDFSEVPE